MMPEQIVREALARHERAIVSFSGGKDSVAVLNACRGFEDRISVFFVDLDDIPQHVRQYVYDICELWGFQLTVIDPPISVHEYHRRAGLPCDMAPAWASPFADQFLTEEERPVTRIVSPFECCNALLWQPMRQAVQASGATLLFRGSKAADTHVSAVSGTVDEGVEIVNPLERMTDLDVFNYLAAYGVKLPRQYQDGVTHSLDCATCTAWASPAEVDRVEWIRKNYPEKHALLQAKTQLVWEEVARQSEKLKPFLEAVAR